MGVFSYADDIEWSLPLFFECEYAYEVIKQTLEEKNIEMTIKTNLFGAPSSRWSGGRTCPILDLKTIEKNFQKVCEMGAFPTLTFTNSNITKDVLNDKDANYILDVALDYNTRFIVASDILRDYIKNKNPEACVLASIIQATLQFQGEAGKNKTFEDETNFYNNELKNYDVVVVRPEYSKFFLPDNPTAISDPSRIEVLINQTCLYSCPKAPEHYHFLEENNETKQNRHFLCIQEEFDKKNINYKKNELIHPKEIINNLVKIGVKRLKIQGRRIPPIKVFRRILENILEVNEGHRALCSEIAVKFMQKYMSEKYTKPIF